MERRARVRLHQAANRMEDADPVDVTVAEAMIRALDVVDRLIGFRRLHSSQQKIPQGVRLPLPEIYGTPYTAGMDVNRLSVRDRARLRQRYRRWEDALRAAGRRVRHGRGSSAGYSWGEPQASRLEELYATWEAEVAEVRARLQAESAARTASD